MTRARDRVRFCVRKEPSRFLEEALVERSQGYRGLLGLPLEPGTEEGLRKEFGLEGGPRE